MNRRTRVLVVCNYALGHAAGQRFRFEQYVDILAREGIETTVAPFFDAGLAPVLHQHGRIAQKIVAVIKGIASRLALLLTVRKYDFVFVHREALPLGPPIIEWLLFALRMKVIYDIDDAIFISRTSEANRLAAPLRWRSKVAYVARRSWRVAACNPYMVSWASQFNADVVLLPTTIDPVYHSRTRIRRQGERPVIGWTGGRSNLPYLELVIPALRELEKHHDFEFRVICDVAPPNPGLKHYSFVPWRLKSEIEDLQQFDVGVMPVPDGLWEKGKVGFKAIQYGALGLVSVASDVASGPEVVVDGVTGLLVRNGVSDWHDALSWVLEHRDRWDAMGAAAREHILAKYSVAAQTPAYIGLFQ